METGRKSVKLIPKMLPYKYSTFLRKTLTFQVANVNKSACYYGKWAGISEKGVSLSQSRFRYTQLMADMEKGGTHQIIINVKNV